MCWNETYSIVWVGTRWSDTVPIMNGLKKGHALSSVLFNFGLEYAIIRVQVNEDGLKLNGTYKRSVYADDGNTLCESVHTTRKKKKHRSFSRF